MSERYAHVNGVDLCYETFGDPEDRPLLLVMGLGTQMIAWHEDFCSDLATRGFYVVRYDNRDTGRSTRFDHVPPPQPLALFARRRQRLAYTLKDMAADAAGLLEELEMTPAHVVGASMGGMIGQMLAIEYPQLVRSFVSIMSTTGSRFVGQPAAAIYPLFLKAAPRSRDEYMKRGKHLWRLIGSPGFPRDDAEIDELLERSYDRGLSPAGTMRQLAAIVASGNRTKDLTRIKAPTLVIHGTDDKMVRVSGGKATARAIPDAGLELIEGMGHDLPRGIWHRLIAGIEQTAARAAGADEREPAAA